MEPPFGEAGVWMVCLTSFLKWYFHHSGSRGDENSVGKNDRNAWFKNDTRVKKTNRTARVRFMMQFCFYKIWKSFFFIVALLKGQINGYKQTIVCYNSTKCAIFPKGKLPAANGKRRLSCAFFAAVVY